MNSTMGALGFKFDEARRCGWGLVIGVLVTALLVLYGETLAQGVDRNGQTRPHIIFIVADDLGWNDVSFHGSGQIPTPNIDALAYSGLILNRYYVAPVCTPSRSALMTGKYAIRTGMQHGVLKGAEARGLPLDEKLLPEYLRELGYRSHIVGKWHLGFYTRNYTPTYRGFESHLGFWSGHHDYFDHTAVEKPYWGLDMRRNMEPAWDLHGRYSTEVFTEESIRLIKAHNASEPLFLYLAHAAVHSSNPYSPLPAPDDLVAGIHNIADYRRRRYAAITKAMDASVGSVIEALANRGMLRNSIVIFTTDNGGPAEGFNLNAASNWPLRGVKDTLFEGGVRGVGLIWSPLLKKSGRVANQTVHVSDWLPTLVKAAGGDPSSVITAKIDGIDLWGALSEDLPSPRSQVLHNIDPISRVSAISQDDWKLIKGSTYNGRWNGWYGPSGRNYSYEPGSIASQDKNPVARALADCCGIELKVPKLLELRAQATVNCGPQPSPKPRACEPHKISCLVNVVKDPCERDNLADRHPEIVARLEAELRKLNASAVTPGNLPWSSSGNPALWNHTWNNFGDYLPRQTHHSSRRRTG